MSISSVGNDLYTPQVLWRYAIIINLESRVNSLSFDNCVTLCRVNTSYRACTIELHNVYYMSVFEAETTVFDDGNFGKWHLPIIAICSWELK